MAHKNEVYRDSSRTEVKPILPTTKLTGMWYRAFGDTVLAHGYAGYIYAAWATAIGIIAGLSFLDIFRYTAEYQLAITYTEMCVVFIGAVFFAVLSYLADKDIKRFRRAALGGKSGMEQMHVEDAKKLHRSRANILGDFNLFVRAAWWLFFEVLLVTCFVFGTTYGTPTGGVGALNAENKFLDGKYTSANSVNGVIATNAVNDIRNWAVQHSIFIFVVIKVIVLLGQFFDRTPVVMLRTKLMQLQAFKESGSGKTHLHQESVVMYGNDRNSVPLETYIS